MAKLSKERIVECIQYFALYNTILYSEMLFMPRTRSVNASTPAATEMGVESVTRALRILEAFEIGEHRLSLAELARRTGLHNSTVLRLARTLALCHFMVQTESAEWRLGPATGWLAARYQAGFDIHDAVEPALQALSQLTQESASFYVREGNERACIARVEGPQSIRHHVRIGMRLPLNLGAPGRVILAFSGESGEPYEGIRQSGYYCSMGERDAQAASVAAPVFGLNWRLLGSLCVSGPVTRLTPAKLKTYADAVMKTANEISYALAGASTPATPKVVSTWHP